MYPRQPDNLLLVEDHADIAEMLTSYLEGRGFALDYAADGLTGMHLAVKNRYDAIILDLMLPGLDGLSICQKLRHEARDSTPIIMLTARDTLDDKVRGLGSGADDYLVKPFAIAELEARVRSQIRRSRGEVAQECLRVDDLVVDLATMRVEHRDQPLNLTPIGFRILVELMRATPAVVTRQALERKVWGDILPDSDTLRSHMYNLRKAVDKPFGTRLIKTVQSSGYRLCAG
ncbi:MAG: response regulator transcription factor [Gammaproteobacteria bacterium]|nr:response regulator transcription factor [Gammaproteobacteria bacterium]